jgi:hypothetical protein
MVELGFMVPSADSTKTVKGLSSILKKEQPKGKRTWCPLSVPANKKNLSSIR